MSETATDSPWAVAHARPRCEKKLVGFCNRHDFHNELPCYKSVRDHRGKTVTFLKPLFPGYVFIRAQPSQKRQMLQSDYIANLLTVDDQELFCRQLGEIREALETDYEIQLAPIIGAGSQVRIRSGPLKGVDGWVEKRYGMSTVLLRLEFIGKAAAVKVNAEDLELI